MSGTLQAPAGAPQADVKEGKASPSLGMVVSAGGIVGMLVAAATFFITLGAVRGAETSRMVALEEKAREVADGMAKVKALAADARDLGLEARLKIEAQRDEVTGLKKSMDRIEAKLDRVLERGK